MAKFILQSDNKSLDIETLIIKELLHKNRYVHEYESVDTQCIKDNSYENYIPIGDINFVTAWLNKNHNIEVENPIEIPLYLRTDEFLKRDYKIVTWNNIPEQGNFFMKDISVLKNFGSVVNADYENIKDWFDWSNNEFDTSLRLDRNHLFQISSIFDIKSEYRVYVIDREIEAISNYNGDTTILPDINLVKKAVNLINYNEKWLKSYTLDIMVGNKGTAIIEVHNFTSVGLYNTLWGSNLLYAYKDGIDYLINDNKKITI